MKAVPTGIAIILAALIFPLVLLFLSPLANALNLQNPLGLNQPESVTVLGSADTQTQNEVASFTAGVTHVSDDKNVAIETVNDQVATLIDSVKAFGIPEGNIQTQNLNIYQQEELEPGSSRVRPGQWRVSNEINVRLEEIDRASELANLLAESGATNVYGPNFTTSDTSTAETDLMDEALNNARTKAEAIATSTGRSLGKVLNVVEAGSGNGVFPLARMDGLGGGGTPIAPGSTQVNKTLTVTFQLK